MNPLTQFKKSKALFLIALALLCFALLPGARAVSPPPDGDYLRGNTAEGKDALFSLTTGLSNTAIGTHSLYSNTTGDFNTATGYFALDLNTTGEKNTAIGVGALYENNIGGSNNAIGYKALNANAVGIENTANGAYALSNNETGNRNTADGYAALASTTGSDNIAVGRNAVSRLSTGSHNIDIGSAGVRGESSTIRIGTVGTQTGTFIAGVHGTTIPAGAGVFVNAAGQLGVLASSARLKTQIKPMAKASEALFALKPVAFRYTKEIDPAGTSQFGLVAEEVEKVNPDLVVRDEQGKAYTVRYDQVNAMLLNEFLKEHSKVGELEAKLAKQEKDFTARLKEQDAKIQQVNDRVELTKPAPRTVLNNQ
jgi:hypothetical protein